MKLFCSIGLSIVYLLSSTGMTELCKLPELIDHYEVHVQEEGHFSFIDFIKLHYFDEEHRDNGEHPHNLPFQNVETTVLIHMPSLPQQMHGVKEYNSFDVQKNWPIIIDLIHSEEDFDIWNPPQGA